MRFTADLAQRTPAQFVHEVLCVDGWHPESVFAGDNWRFGAGGRGTVRTLTQLSEGRIQAIVVPPVFDGGDAVSSTRIRNAISDGDIATATRLLGCPYRLRARVVHGRGIGHRLGYATANLVPNAEVLPPHGIYALWAEFGGVIHRAVCDFGTSPTFPEGAPQTGLIEVHVLDFDGDLYGNEIDIAFVARLRDERRFESAAALVDQIRKDVDVARALLGEPPDGLFPPPCPYVPTDSTP
jgi:riboflavin kinase/FMN adenylyltransferase